MIKPTSPLASSTIISVSLGVTEPSWSANPSQVADRTKRLASVIPLRETLSNNSTMLILLFEDRAIRHVHAWHSNRANGCSATRMKTVPKCHRAAIPTPRASGRLQDGQTQAVDVFSGTLLKPLGHRTKRASRWFAACEVLRLSEDIRRLDRTTIAVH